MKKFAITLLVIVLLAGAAVVILPKFVSMDTFEAQAKEKFHAATGRDLAFSGLKFVFFPNIGVQLNDVTISNAAWAKDKDMISLGTLDVQLALQPLFHKQVEVKRFILKAPVIHLETTADGKNNWTLDSAAAKDAASGGDSGAAGAASDFTFKLGEFQISDGQLTFADGASKTTRQLDDIDATITMADLQSPLALNGALTYLGKRVSLSVNLKTPMALTGGKTSDGTASIKTDVAQAAVDGIFDTRNTYLNGKIDANVSSLSKLAAWLGGDVSGKAPAQKLPFETAVFQSTAELTASTLDLRQISLKLDDVEAGGDVKLGFGGRPNIWARLSLPGKLDLDRFTGGDAKDDAKTAAPAKSGADAGWDDTPLDFSGLKAADADLILLTHGFSLKGVDVGASTLTAQLKEGTLHFTTSAATLFSGQFSSDLSLNAAQTPPTMAFKFSMTGVQAKPVLTTFANFTKLSGAVDANVDVSGFGQSQKAIVESMSGQGAATFRNGTLEGIDLVNIAKLLQSELGDMGVGDGKTDFVDLGGTFTVTRGVADNEDFKMHGPLVQASGKGTVDFPHKQVAYRVTPVLTASSATDNAKGVSVPVDIKGPFSDIKIKPDYAGAIQNVINNPGDAKAVLKDVKTQGASLLKDIKKDPSKALNGLLGGGLFGKQPAAPAPATAPAPAQ